MDNISVHKSLLIWKLSAHSLHSFQKMLRLGSPFNAASIAVTGDPLTNLYEDLAAEQKARAVYDNILKLSDDPDVNEVIKFLRQREVVHFQRFGEAILTHSNRFGGYIACVKMQFIDIENYKFLLEILLLINVSRGCGHIFGLLKE